MKKCFIVGPIGDPTTDTRKRSDSLLKHVLKPVCSECGFEAIRIDEMYTGESITQNILDNLKNCDLVIADLTEHNPNAFFELGYRTALEKPIIQIKLKSEPIPFDIASIQTFDYDLTDLEAVDEFKSRISKTIKSFNFDSVDSAQQQPDHPNTFNSTILQEIYKTQDMIKQLLEKSSISDTAAVSVLADKLSETSAKSTDAVIMETLMSKFLEDPKKIIELAALAEQLPSKD